MAKENSVERANRLIESIKDDIEDYREDEIEAKKRIAKYEKELAEKKQAVEVLKKEIKDLEDRISDENEWISDVQDSKVDCLINIQALTLFVQQGGGLDMIQKKYKGLQSFYNPLYFSQKILSLLQTSKVFKEKGCIVTNGSDSTQRTARLITYLDKEITQINGSVSKIEQTIEDRTKEIEMLKSQIKDLKSRVQSLTEANEHDKEFMNKLLDDQEDHMVEISALRKYFESLDEEECWFQKL